MNDNSSSRPEAVASPPVEGKILVWDVPLRVFHWLLVVSFFGAWLSAESEQWELLHVTLGYTVLGLILFRLVWGVFGTRHARFSSFVRGRAAVGRYLRSLLHGKPEHYIGHNPAGAVAIIVLLILGLAVSVSGWAVYATTGGEAFEELHEVLATFMLVIVGVHVAAVLAASWIHGENLVGAMLTGRKRGRPADGIKHSWIWLGLLLLAVVFGLCWWQLTHPTEGLARPERTAENHETQKNRMLET